MVFFQSIVAVGGRMRRCLCTYFVLTMEIEHVGAQSVLANLQRDIVTSGRL